MAFHPDPGVLMVTHCKVRKRRVGKGGSRGRLRVREEEDRAVAAQRKCAHGHTLQGGGGQEGGGQKGERGRGGSRARGEEDHDLSPQLWCAYGHLGLEGEAGRNGEVVRGKGQGREQGNEQVTGKGGWHFAPLCSWPCIKGRGGCTWVRGRQ